jgi:hypothetical protein
VPPQSLICAPGDQFNAWLLIGPEKRRSAVQPVRVRVDSVPSKLPPSRLPVSTPEMVPANPVLLTKVPVRLSPGAALPLVAAVVASASTAPPGILKKSEMSHGTWMKRALVFG